MYLVVGGWRSVGAKAGAEGALRIQIRHSQALGVQIAKLGGCRIQSAKCQPPD